MSEERRRRLAKLVRLENRMKAFHESRHAGHLADANRAAADAAEIGTRFDDPDSLSSLFPEVYHRGIEAAHDARLKALDKAREEERQVAAATVRANRVEDRYREAARVVDEHAAARERQEFVDRSARPGKPATS
jgi:hypothetical protein